MSFDQVAEVAETKEEVAEPKETWAPSSSLSRAEREEMKALSKAVFGNTSKWQAMIDKGAPIRVTKRALVEEKQEDGTIKEVEKDVPVLLNGAPYSVVKRYCAGELKALLIETKQKVQEMNEAFAKQQIEAAQKKAAAEQAKQVQEEAGGQAI